MFLSGIYVYPVKSLKGISLPEARIEARGLQNDRRFMLIDSTNRFISQREQSTLATVSATVETDRLKISAPDKGPLFIPFDSDGSDFVSVQVWESVCRATLVSPEADEWFSELLRSPTRLVHMPEETRRPVKREYAVGDDVVSFADAFPFLLATEASLQDLNGRLDKALPMNRFRPNLVVSGATPFAEDGWRTISIGGSKFHVVKPCDRCVTTTVDQERGVRDGNEPLRTLATFRRQNNQVYFGQNLIADNALGKVRVGDPVEVIE